MTSEQITVTDADRQAAAEWVRGDYGWDESAPSVQAIIAGKNYVDLAQAFARHRTEAEARVLKHAEAMAAHLEWAHERIESGDAYDRMCCDGHMCGCQGASKGEEVVHFGREALAAYRADYPEKNDDQ